MSSQRKMWRQVLRKPTDGIRFPVSNSSACDAQCRTQCDCSEYCLLTGWVLIAQGNWKAHRAVMVAAFSVSAIFLVSYLTYHYLVGHVTFGGQGVIRTVYLCILSVSYCAGSCGPSVGHCHVCSSVSWEVASASAAWEK